MSSEEKYCLFIDFQPSYCCLYDNNGGKAELVGAGYGHSLNECIFSVSQTNGEVQVYRQGAESYGSDTVIKNTISVLGWKSSDKGFDIIKKCISGTLEDHEGRLCFVCKGKNENFYKSCEELMKLYIAEVIKHVKTLRKRGDIPSVRFSIPEYLNAEVSKRVETILQDLIKENGVESVECVPSHVASFYGFQLTMNVNRTVLLIHYGTNAFTYFLVEVNDGKIELKQNGGNLYGGAHCIYDAAETLLLEKYESQEGHKYITEEDEKKPKVLNKKMNELKSQTDSILGELVTNAASMVSFGKKQQVDIVIKQEEFEEVVKHAIETSAIVAMSDVDKSTVTQVCVEGEGSRDSFFRSVITNYFSEKPTFAETPDSLIAIGLYNYYKTTTENKKIVPSFTEYDYGLVLEGGVMEVIIPKGTHIPYMCNADFTTFQEFQSEFLTYVCQRSDVNSELSIIDSYHIKNLEKRAPGELDFEFAMEINREGVLFVKCIENQNEVVLIEKKSYALYCFVCS